MRKIEFEVPVQVIVEFTDELTQRNLSNSITGTNDESEILIEVEYEKDESKEVDELEGILADLCENIEEESEEENDD